jgi:flagellar protein FliL
MSMTATKSTEKDAAEEPKSRFGGFVRTLGIALIALALVGAAVWWFVLRPGPPQEPKPGAIAPLESIQINLADSHYLRLGLGLQLTTEVTEIDGSRALDAAIALYSGRKMEWLAQPAHREELRKQLAVTLDERYEGEVMGVYYTEFVTQ